MRKFFFIALAALVSCKAGPIRFFYTPELPVLPDLHKEILGEAHWRIEWIDGEGNWAHWEGKDGFPHLNLNEEWAVPVLAWPFWPEKNINPGNVYPAGAIFPWDIKGDRIILDWKKGVDAFLWKELAEQGGNQREKGIARFPWYFDWPRFRELMETGDIPEEIKSDPWLADWKFIAEKTNESGFDRRRIKIEDRKEIGILCLENIWAASSVFAEALVSDGVKPLVFLAKETPESLFSKNGLLRIAGETWFFVSWENF